MFKILKFLPLYLLFISCGKNDLELDTSGVKVNIEFVQLDEEVWNTPLAQLPARRSQWASHLGEIYDYHFAYCMQIGTVVDTAFVNAISDYRKDTMIQSLEKEIRNKFSDLSVYQDELKSGFLRLYAMNKSWGYPKQIVWHNSLFQASVFATESQLAIGLERYLGAKSNSVRSLPSDPFYDWIKNKFEAEFLVRDALYNWVLTNGLNVDNGNLAERMINYGKALVFVEAAMNTKNKEQIVRYSKEDYKWAIDNEASFWKFLVDQKALFKTDERNAANIFNDGPFTAGLPEKAPDRLGQFLGWRIVKQYVETNKINAKDLLNVPYNRILQNYKID